ncbi:DUF3800 domain-containing protein [Thermoactinomyces sp. CICC 23799]|uniref:DUF3800 domain-containing protein n=1 Tax=Thermoactinomyces sp. CICC 23799 TaxID=2767429 RepID=UPI0018DCAF5A|nr:DUF3800 domain-containing protein [Thermoactinomyces sp. CICC 23799]MBH8600531.1 DUF3800 domain-containing protein [Thermoactinomyces sp. CICC 23799]
MGEWWEKPTLIDYWPKDVDSLMALDENGTTDLQFVSKNLLDYLFNKKNSDLDHNKWFTITGIVMDHDQYPSFRHNIIELKKQYWENGLYHYKDGLKRVVFHSREIRKRLGPFNPKLIKYNEFITDISKLIKNTTFSIYSSSINKAKHVLKYSDPFPVYTLCLEFIVERYCRKLNEENKNGILLLESRGKKEDKIILAHIINILKHGNWLWSSSHFSRIKGVYFNPKWSMQQSSKASYILLELADLVSYPIHKYVKTENKDKAFNIIEPKFFNYPNISGFGLKVFP